MGEGEGVFYFLEMNSRLQVEHPVTEMVTGLDLVELQFRVAAGEALPNEALSPTFSGHAIEARVCAEDPNKRFFPSPGTITYASFPTAMPGVRVDAAVGERGVVSPAYDSLVAKIIAHGSTRTEAIERMRAAIAGTRIDGVATNLEIFPRILAHDDFLRGVHDTGFLSKLLDPA